MNPLFYNVNVIEEAGVDPDGLDSLDALMAAFDKIDSDTDATAFAQSASEAWTTLQLWETIFLATGGHGQYQTFTGGGPGDTESATKEALQYIVDMRDYFPGDSTSMTYPGAAQSVVDGNAGFFHQGDWAAGIFLDLDDMVYKEDWDWIPFPGTGSMYAIVMDGFPYPAPNRSSEATKKFLRYCGTAEAQELFNPVKGSIPPRTDVSTDPFSEFQKNQIENFQNSESQPNSIAHGLAVTPAQRTDLLSVISRFTSNWEVNTTFDGFVKVFQ
jgi:glucose/mannose transport system substrate-binding protein